MNALHRFCLLAGIALTSSATALAAGTETPATPRAGVVAIRHDLEAIAAVAPEQFARDIRALALADLPLAEPALEKFSRDLLAGLGGRPVADAFVVNWLAGDLDLIFHAAPGRQVGGPIDDFGSALRKAGVEPGLVATILADVRAVVPQLLGEEKQVGPEHKYRYKLSEAPKYDRSVLVEDFELDGEIWKTWYQPGWSTGIVAKVQTEYKAAGTRGLTLSHTGPAKKYTSVAKIPNPYQSLEGMNALRMWIHPHSSGKTDEDRAGPTTGFIDGSGEIWQMGVPDLAEGTEPYILEIRLADFKYILRRNNGIIDLENQDFAFWIGGTYSFSVDDIRFVHDPAIPDFVPAVVP